jgi:hypothetical protein
MKNLITSNITSTIGMPVKSGTLLHLQSAYKEALDFLARGLVMTYQANTVYRIFGCINQGSPTDYNITAGAVFYNGEIYLVDATTFTLSVGQVAIATISSTFFTDPTADPVTFTDGVARNVHEIRKAVIAPGLSGGGVSDFLNFKRANKGRLPKGAPVAYYPPSGTLNDFDTTGKGISGDVIGWALCNGQNGTLNLKGRVIAGYDPVDPDFNDVNKIAGEKNHTLVKAELPNITLKINSANGNAIKYGAEVPGSSNVDNTRNDANEVHGEVGWKTEPMGSGQAHNVMQPYRVLLYIQEID